MPGIIDLGLCTGELFAADVTMHKYSWCVLDVLDPLWTPQARRSGNGVLPYAEGQIAFPTWIDQATINMRFAISGFVDADGDPAPDLDAAYEIYEANLLYLNSIFNPPAWPAAGISGEIVLPSGTSRTADDLQFVLKPGTGSGPVRLHTLQMTIPRGLFLP